MFYFDVSLESLCGVDVVVLDVVGVSIEEDGFGLLVNVVFGGEIVCILGELKCMCELGMNLVGLLLVIEWCGV